jgi:YVTN family beta-propeller protein
MITNVSLACLLVVATAVPAQKPARPPKPGVSTPGVKIPMTKLTPEAVFDVPGAPDWLAIDEQVWVSNAPKNSVSRLDPKTNKVLATITVGKEPGAGLAVGFGSLWVPNCGDSTLTRIDLKTGEISATFACPIADSEGGIATGAGSVWIVTDSKSKLARIDPATNKIAAEIDIAPGSVAAAFGEGAVWVTSPEKNVLSRVDAATNKLVETIPVGKKPRFLTIGAGSVWTLDQGDGSITRVDPQTNKVVATIEAGIPGGGGELAFGEGSIWATVWEYPITRIDPATNQVAQQFTGAGGDSIRVGHGSVWLSNVRLGSVWRLDVKKLVATKAD